MSAVPDAKSIVLRSCKPLAPPFHRHIAKSRLMNQSCRAGDRVVIYEVVSTEPDGVVQVTGATRIEFE
jgi:hypothetical protein